MVEQMVFFFRKKVFFTNETSKVFLKYASKTNFMENIRFIKKRLFRFAIQGIPLYPYDFEWFVPKYTNKIVPECADA